MRHRKKTVKLGRSQAHRDALLANQVCSLIIHQRIRTTLAKAKATRSLAEKMVTLGKKGTLHARRTAAAYLHQADAVKRLFEDIAPRSASRAGGYTRIIKLGARKSDSAPMAILEWVDNAVIEAAAQPTEAATVEEKKPAAKKKAPVKKAKPKMDAE
jgi:large subunit ribosomal protein L17